MPHFVHIADERDSAAIRRAGLKLPRPPAHASPASLQSYGVFALPVTPNFLVSHQWVRELKRRGFKVAVGVYFRVSGEEQVWAGKYNEAKVQMSAAHATAQLRHEQTLGFEVILPRSVQASDIETIKALPQKLGWRYFPGAHERGIFCGCEYCQRGSIKSRRIRLAYEQRAL
jgi:hypothetical protein